MSMLGPYASWNKETGYAIWDHPTAEHKGIFERINHSPKGIIHCGMWDFIEYGCYTKLVGDNVIGVEANPQVYSEMSKPIADKFGFKCFNEFLVYNTTFKKDTILYQNYALFPGEGAMVLFPSSLYHCVEPNKSNEDRISVSFNVEVGGILPS